jgi:hypothetical protein
MSESTLQQSPEEVSFSLQWEWGDLGHHLRALRTQRNDAVNRAERPRRVSLRPEERGAILGKTGNRCHICGGRIDPNLHWEADHVLGWAVGGGNRSDNYLAAHGTCNTYRWHHSPEEMQWILKIGIWARRQMEGSSKLGTEMLKLFFENERRRENRKKANRQTRSSDT